MLPRTYSSFGDRNFSVQCPIKIVIGLGVFVEKYDHISVAHSYSSSVVCSAVVGRRFRPSGNADSSSLDASVTGRCPSDRTSLSGRNVLSCGRNLARQICACFLPVCRATSPEIERVDRHDVADPYNDMFRSPFTGMTPTTACPMSPFMFANTAHSFLK